MADSKTNLTAKQKRFVEFYDGNGTETARKAGYKGNDNTLNQVAIENLRKPMILEAIEKRESERLSEGILDREKRQVFWSKVIEDENQKMPDRLRASELLGKSEADFIDKQEIDIKFNGIGIVLRGESRNLDKEIDSKYAMIEKNETLNNFSYEVEFRIDGELIKTMNYQVKKELIQTHLLERQLTY